jgi:hypothetical protein
MECEKRGSAAHLYLYAQPSSASAEKLTSQVADRAWTHVKLGKRIPSTEFVRAVGAFLGGLLRTVSLDPAGYSYRAMGRDTFSGAPVGYRPFKNAVDGLAQAGFVEVRRGTGGGTLIGVATRFRATPALLTLASALGVSPVDWPKHFRPAPRPKSVRQPILLRASSRVIKGGKMPGRERAFDPTEDRPSALAQQVNDLNAFFAEVRIEPEDQHYAFQRIFNQGDLPGFDWNKGGRLYSLGGGYQIQPSIERAKMMLNGEPVVEIDIQASHLTILHALLGHPFKPGACDPYAVPGIPRDVVKAWVTMTLGYDKFQSRWSRANKDKYKEKHGGELQREYPIRFVREQVLEALPVLSGWESCSHRWGDLQYLESCAVVGAVHKLAMRHAVPALPVHDSLIVPRSKQKLTRKVLSESFRCQVGVRPALSTS